MTAGKAESNSLVSYLFQILGMLQLAEGLKEQLVTILTDANASVNNCSLEAALTRDVINHGAAQYNNNVALAGVVLD